MAINAYTGLMGSGKTYEVVLSVLLPAIKSGRDVVTNIRGLNYELICAHLKQPDEGREFGKIRVVNNEQVQRPDFFPAYNDAAQKFDYTKEAVVQPGNLVAIDEAWRPWGTDSTCVKAHMSFFREHRQCVDASGRSSDLVVISQDITDLHKLLKNVVEMSMLFTKLKTLGMSKRYRLEVYEGSKLYKTKLSSWSTRTYDKRIFPLYKSYASESGSGVEAVVDARQNIFKSGSFMIPIALAIVFIGVGWWKLSEFFHPSSSGAKAVPAPAVQSSPSPSPAGTAAAPASVASTALPASKTAAPLSIAGSLVIGGDRWAVLATAEGLRVVSPSTIYSRGVSAITKDDKKAVPAYLNHE